MTYGAGDSFGELALLHSVPRAATVSTSQATSVWIMERKYYTHFKRNYFKTVRRPPGTHRPHALCHTVRAVRSPSSRAPARQKAERIELRS